MSKRFDNSTIITTFELSVKRSESRNAKDGATTIQLNNIIMTNQGFKKAALLEGIKVYSATKTQSRDGYWNGYKVTYAILLGNNTISAETSKEIEADSYEVLLGKITNNA